MNSPLSNPWCRNFRPMRWHVCSVQCLLPSVLNSWQRFHVQNICSFEFQISYILILFGFSTDIPILFYWHSRLRFSNFISITIVYFISIDMFFVGLLLNWSLHMDYLPLSMESHVPSSRRLSISVSRLKEVSYHMRGFL